LPILYLKGISSGDFSEALAAIMGESSGGFSASVITRLKSVWEEEHSSWSKRSLAGKEYVYVWADGIHVGVRLGEDDSVCLLVLVGATANGDKELIAVIDGYRESTESWLGLLRDLKRRGLKAPLLAIGDGALGFWGAIGEAYPETKHQRCWLHKMRNVLNYLPKRLQAQAKARLNEMQNADTRELALEEMKIFAGEYGAKHPKAVECLEKDAKELLAFYDFPAEHWGHLRTTNPIESPFATVRLRTKKTKGAGSRTTAMTMTFKLLESAEKRWRKINAPQMARKLWEGAKFTDGVDLTSPKPEVDELSGKKVMQTKRKAA
jgi:transposase-like protein